MEWKCSVARMQPATARLLGQRLILWPPRRSVAKLGKSNGVGGQCPDFSGRAPRACEMQGVHQQSQIRSCDSGAYRSCFLDRRDRPEPHEFQGNTHSTLGRHFTDSVKKIGCPRKFGILAHHLDKVETDLGRRIQHGQVALHRCALGKRQYFSVKCLQSGRRERSVNIANQ